MIRMTKIFSSIALGTILVACNVLPSNPPVNTYRLAPSTVDVHVTPLPLSLSIPMPYANRFIAHQRLAVVTEDNEVRAYHGARWEDAAPAVFRDRLVSDFQRTQAYKTVMTNDENVTVDRALRLDLQDYQLQYKQQQPYVVMTVNTTLVNRTTGQVIAARRFAVEKQSSSAHLKDILPLFSQLNDAINAQIIQWTNQQERTVVR